PQLSHGLLPPLERPDTQADRYCLAMIFLYSLYSSQRAARKKGSSSLVAASHSCRATLSVSSHPGTVGAASSGGGVRATAGPPPWPRSTDAPVRSEERRVGKRAPSR